MTRRASSPVSGGITVSQLAPARAVSVRDVIRAVRLAGKDRSISALNVVLASDELLARLHGRFMGDPTPTDVLTFDLREDVKARRGAIEGEVVVSVETASREAKRRGLSLRVEVLRYVIHGTLHLVGYDDGTPVQQRRMRREEDRVLACLEKRVSRAGHRAPKREKRR
jgi:probable rRNA maturation factor